MTINDIRIVLRSTDCVDYSKDNEKYNFRIKLIKPLNLDESWKISLTDKAFSNTKKIPRQEMMYICSNICKKSYVGSSVVPLLRNVLLYNKTDSSRTFDNRIAFL